MFDRCPDLGRVFPSSASGELTRHLETCASCRNEWTRMEEVASLARSIPVGELPADRAATVRNAILVAAAKGSPARRSGPGVWLGSLRVRAALVIAASLMAIVLVARLRPRSNPTPHRARIVAGASARFTHQGLPDETIRLVDGTVSLDVDDLAEGERLRVITGDAEVEVRGTSFVVEAAGDELAWVHVLKGRVEVRASGHAPVLLGALEHWRPAARAVLPSPTPAEVAAVLLPPAAPRPIARAITAAPAVNATVTPPIPLPLDMETPYRAAWDAFRRGDLDEAATGFDAVARASKDGALASDAAYWRAVALGRAGRSPEAVHALREYLRRFPEAPQAGEASAMLGWLLFDADPDAARRSFEQAIRSGSEAAVTSGSEGLEALSKSTR